MDSRYPNPRGDFRTYQSDLRDDGDMAGVAVVLALIGGTFLAIGLFIGWMLFTPPALATDCGSVETCMVRAEEGV